MKKASFAVLAALTLAVSTTAVRADNHDKDKGFRAVSISKVAAQTFQLKQTATKKVGDNTTQSVYTGDAALNVTPSQGGAPYSLAVKVELRTQTTLDTLGDGFTDGYVTLRDPATGQAVAGDLVATNANFGQLNGVLQGALFGGKPNAPLALRANFNATFVPDANGAYTLVNVSAGGVLYGPAKSSGK